MPRIMLLPSVIKKQKFLHLIKSNISNFLLWLMLYLITLCSFQRYKGFFPLFPSRSVIVFTFRSMTHFKFCVRYKDLCSFRFVLFCLLVCFFASGHPVVPGVFVEKMTVEIAFTPLLKLSWPRVGLFQSLCCISSVYMSNLSLCTELFWLL